MIRRVLLVCVFSIFCLGALAGCTPTPGVSGSPAATVPPSTTAAE